MRLSTTSRTSGLLGAFFLLTTAPSVAETIRIDGSNGVRPLVAALAEAYRAQHPEVTIEIGPGLGAGERLPALTAGKIDIAMASHGVVPQEIARQGMAFHTIAKVAVVFGVHASVPLPGLTESQVCDIYAGRVTRWKELGGPGLAIAPRARPETEVDAEVLRAGIGCLKDLAFAPSVRQMPATGDMARELASTVGAIGMTTMTVVEQSGERIRALSLNGVAPREDNVRDQSYRLTRDTFLVTQAVPPPAVARFLDFIRGPEGTRVIAANGAVAVLAPQTVE